MKKAILFAVIVTMAVPALSQAQGRSRDEQRRNQIRMIEGVLVQAVRLGAAEVSKEMQRFEPAGVTVLTGMPRARGFLLDGYGVFFDVEIPDMNQSVIWSMMDAQRDRQVGNALESLVAAIGNNARGTQPATGAGSPPAGDQDRRAGGANARAAGPGATRTWTGRRCDGDASASRGPSEAVKSALVEAMLGYSVQMDLGADEWLTVAARASEGPVPWFLAGLSELITIVLRVKGSDLSIYHADPTKRDEIRQRVKVEARVF